MSAFQFVRENLNFLSAGMLLTLNSSFGQTFFISIFAAEIMRDFSLSNGEWGLLYTLGTTASAVVMFWAGVLTDRFRARTLACFVMPGLAVTCMAMGVSQSIVGLLLIVFFLRLFGQGMIFQLASVSMARWFVGRRGLALSVSGLGFWTGQAALPVIFAALLVKYDWHYLWFLSAAFVLVCFPLVLGLLTQERTPKQLAEEEQSFGMEGRHWERREVIKSPLFLMAMPLLIGLSAWGTALFFQQVHIADIKGWPLVDYLALIPLMTVVAVVATLVTGNLVDRFGSGRLLQFFPVTSIAGFLFLAFAENLAVAAVAFVVFGVSAGMQATLITSFWAEYFGTKHIGAIKATSTSILVFGSAIGPGVSGLAVDAGYFFPTQMTWIAGYFAISMGLVWFAVEKARKSLPTKVHVEST